MAKRDYNGPAIDASWSDPPWVNDGETVDVIDTDEDGDMSVDLDGEELFPEPWEPTEEQVARARWLLLNTEMTGLDISERLGISGNTLSNYITGNRAVNPESPPPITSEGGGADYDVMEKDTEQAELSSDTSEFNGIKPGTPLARSWKPTESQVAQARGLLLQTDATAKDLAKCINASHTAISKHIRGDSDINPHDPPPLTGLGRRGEYIPREEVNDRNERQKGAANNGATLSKEDVINIRKRLVDGETRADIAEEYDLSTTTIGDYAAGRKSIDPDEIKIHCEHPTKGWERIGGEQTDADQSGTNTDEQTESEPESDPEQETDTKDTVHVTPTVHSDNDTEQDTTTPAVVGFVVGVVVSAIVRRLTSP